MALRSVVEEREPAYVSTGHLPDAETMQSLVNDAQRHFQSNRAGTSGQVYGAGDVDCEFSIMSASKPFLVALVCETIGPEEARTDPIGAGCAGGIVAAVIAVGAADKGRRMT